MGILLAVRSSRERTAVCWVKDTGKRTYDMECRKNSEAGSDEKHTFDRKVCRVWMKLNRGEAESVSLLRCRKRRVCQDLFVIT